MTINKDHLLEAVDVSISKSWKLPSLIIYESTLCSSDSLALLTTKPEIRPLGNNVDEDIDTIYTSTPTRVHIIRPCLVPLRFAKFFKIIRHIESLDAYMKH